MTLNKARKEWNELNDFDKKGYLAMFRYRRKTDIISDEEAIKLYCKYHNRFHSEYLILFLIILIIFIIFL